MIRVLLVENNELNADMLSRRLVQRGMSVDVVRSAEQALVLLSCAMLPEIVLTDVRLPGIDGIEFVRRLRATANTKKIPVIAVTGDVLPEVLDEAVDAGCNRCVMKPIDFDHLVEAIQAIVWKDASV